MLLRKGLSLRTNRTGHPRKKAEGTMGQKGKKEVVRRTRRRDNGMARTAGIAKAPRRDRLTRTLQLLRAALRLWEVRHEQVSAPRVWRKQLVRTEEAVARVKHPGPR